jgi:hypothetical protein
MAGGWSTQPDVDDLDDIEGWMAQRNADVGLRQQADAFARDLWNQATRSGDDLAAQQSGDLTSIGLAALGSGAAPDGSSSGLASSDVGAPPLSEATPQASVDDTGAPAAQSNAGTPSYQIVTAQPGDSISRLLGTSRPDAVGRFASVNGLTGSALKAGSNYYIPTSYDDATPDEISAGNQLLRSDNARLAVTHAAANDAQANLFAQRLNSGLNVWTGEIPDHDASPVVTAKEPAHWWDQWGPVKGIAGTAAFAAGAPIGFARGAIHFGQDIGNDLDFGVRLLDPSDAENHLPGEGAWDQAADKVRGVLSYGQQRLADRGKLANDVGALGHDARVNLDPLPIAPTLGDQLGRNFSVGQNWGEGAFDLGSILEGGDLIESLRGAEAASDAAKAPAYIRPGAPPALEAYLEEPYDGLGAHFVPRRAKFPETVAGIPVPQGLVGKPLLPQWYMDSPFNVWKPDGISRGKFYEEHFRMDDRMYGAPLPRKIDGGRGWSGNRLGLERYSPAGRIWRGAPAPLKAAVGGSSTAIGLGIYDDLNPGLPQ